MSLQAFFRVRAVTPTGDHPVVATSGGSGARNRYFLGNPFESPSEVSQTQLQTVVARAFESPGVTEVVVLKSEV